MTDVNMVEPTRRWSAASNALFALRLMRRHAGARAVGVFVLDVAIGVAQPFLAAALPSVVVAALTSGWDPLASLALVAVSAALIQALGVLRTWADRRATWNDSLARIWGGLDMCRDALAADYRFIESDEANKKMQAAEMAFFQDMSIGVGQVLLSLRGLVTGEAGMVAYGAVIGSGAPGLLALITLLTAGAVAGNAWASNRSFEVMGPEFQTSEEFSYLRRQTISPENGKDIRLYRMAAWFSRAFADVIERDLALRDVEYRAFERSGYLAAALALARDAAAYALLIARLLSGALDLPAFLLMVGMVSGFGTWMQAAFEGLTSLTQNARHVGAYRDFHADCEPSRGGEGVARPGRAHEIRFDHVCFSYDGRTDAVHDLTLTIRAGEKVALVGVNGAGKTTLVKLACGLYRPSSGAVYLDGQDVSAIERRALWRELSVVFQDCFPFSFSVADNVTCADDPASVDEGRLAESLERADLAEKVDGLPHGADTRLGQDVDPEGVSLSGGETQRLMLARALYKDAPVVLLDEPTAALDPLAERQMYERYDELTHGKTSVFISHRLSSTRFCERVVFMEGGRVVEEGTHDELMAAGGAYARMFETQARYYEDGELGAALGEKDAAHGEKGGERDAR